jgi:hypothetical protein
MLLARSPDDDDDEGSCKDLHSCQLYSWHNDDDIKLLMMKHSKRELVCVCEKGNLLQ